ncbi:MAG TPA: TIGR03557 family F420-dependent LLM class oxidoreductase [Spongiibacteraceae bacterium]|jgi:TAT-translocated FGD2 family F420-dependent dehydrogenase
MESSAWKQFRWPLRRRNILQSAGLLLAATASAVAGNALAATGNTLTEAQSTQRKKNMSSLAQRSIGFMLGHEQFTAAQLIDLGVAAEKAGFDLLATSDHFQPWQDNEGHSSSAWVTLAALGQRTQSIWIGPTVTCPTLRYNPAVVAETFASLSLLYPDRVFLGIGSGEALNEQAATGDWPNWQQRSERLIEATELIRKLWTGEQIVHDGKYYRVNAKLYDAPTRPLPILMAANGPKAMRRAGQYGDGLVTDPKTWKEHKSKFEEGLAAAGKKLGDVPVLVEHYVVVGDKKEAEVAAELWRFGPKAFKGYHNIADPRTIHQRADSEIPLEKVYADWAIGTDPTVHIRAIEELFASGATIVNIHSGQKDQARVIDFYGSEVLKRVRRQSLA